MSTLNQFNAHYLGYSGSAHVHEKSAVNLEVASKFSFVMSLDPPTEKEWGLRTTLTQADLSELVKAVTEALKLVGKTQEAN